jgi:hypothetical protein
MADGIFNGLKKTYNIQQLSLTQLTRRNNPEEERAYQKEYYKQNCEYLKKQARMYHTNNKDKHSAVALLWRQKNTVKIKEYRSRPEVKIQAKKNTVNNNKRVKMQVLNHYGSECGCCGIDILEFLSIHHMCEEMGREHRRNKIMGTSLYRWIIRSNFPKGFKTMCMNCNHAMGRRNSDGMCPHHRIKGGM